MISMVARIRSRLSPSSVPSPGPNLLLSLSIASSSGTRLQAGASCGSTRRIMTLFYFSTNFATLPRPQPYLYTCVRCKWIFRVNDSHGSIIALDGLGRRLPEPENSKRIVTFRRGQCPAFSVFEDLAPEVQGERRLLGYLSRFVDALHSPTNGRGRGHRRAEQTAAS